ncbi:hypothetical protein MBAV_006002 [Candidatus Magnetobacterium bavaricum]|uniref:Uncharacterized protein n=1 Tax=Candidatus Magnetobacterium bavaricum TaxID=29290 RepID=A0A0F3GIQ6_9BACT|nr:hypothetical protein MBAV_006002 [Candidatus Magnetobacterium bavaricum]
MQTHVAGRIGQMRTPVWLQAGGCQLYRSCIVFAGRMGLRQVYQHRILATVTVLVFLSLESCSQVWDLLVCSLATTGRLRPGLKIRPTRGASACTMAASTPSISPVATSTCGRYVP